MFRGLTPVTALLTLATVGCLDTAPSDAGAPVVVITSPTTFQVSGLVTIRASVVDDRGVAGVAFFIDTTKLVEFSAGPYEYAWASTSVADGNHELKVIAIDINGNTTTAIRPLIVSNNPSTPN